MKKIITLVSTLTMIFALSIFFTASAKELTEDQFLVVIDNVEYEVDKVYEEIEYSWGYKVIETNRGKSYHVKNFFYDKEVAKKQTEINIVSEINGLPVTSVSPDYDKRTSLKKNITKVTIPDTVESLGSNAFQDFISLKEIKLPKKLKTIGYRAFDGCTNLKKVIFNDRLEAIYEKAFIECKSLTTVKFPESLKKIDAYAFLRSGLKEVEIPENCIIRHRAFKECKNLKKVTINFSGEDADYYTIPKAVFYNCENLEAIYFTAMKTQLKTGEYAFTGCDKLKDIYFFGSETLWKETCMSGKRSGYYKEFDIHYYYDHTHKFEKAKSTKNTLKFACDCGDEYTFTANNTGKHNYTKWNTVKKASCVVGAKHTFTCKDCGKKATFKLKESNKHDLGQWKTVKKATVKAKGKMERACRDCGLKETKNVEKLTAVSSLKISLYKGGTVTYKEGSPTTIKVYVKDGKTELTENLHYKLTFKNNTKVTNKAVVIVEGVEKNGYSGKVELNYTIKPRALKDADSKETETTIKLTWKAVEEADGYVIYVNNYREDIDYHKEFYTTKTSYTIKNLKPQTGYGIEIRSCVIEDGKRILGNSVFEIVQKTK